MNPSSQGLALWPAAASVGATNADYLILAFTVLTLVLVIPIFIGITVFAVRYRDGRPANRNRSEDRDRILELSWMLIPFVLTLGFFAWGARAYIGDKRPPGNASTVEAIGRQWMWKFQHPTGQSEINDLHVPVGQPIRIHMISQDVLHSLYIPALRIQMETIPGRYTELWFNANRVGEYRILCSEFCGTDHSVMGGMLYVMTAKDYAAWLGAQGQPANLADSGRDLFASYGCGGCHGATSTEKAPGLAGLYNQPVTLASGRTVTADATFLRDKILNPGHNKLPNYKPVMPNFAGVVSEDDMERLLAFIEQQPAPAAAAALVKTSDNAPSTTAPAATEIP